MPNKYVQMNDWSDIDVALFKEQAKDMSDIETSQLTVISEGDSWFDYRIGVDLIDCLRRVHGYRIRNFARLGDTLENMIYGTEINRRFVESMPQIKVILERVSRTQPDVFLFSGGGNDVVGNAFASFLHHADSGLGILKESYARDTIKIVFKKYYQDLIGQIHERSTNTHIFTHGYGYARPTGDGAGILGFDFVGPWMKPVLAMKRINIENDGRQVIETLIDFFNQMLEELDQENERFHFVDLRSIIQDDDWRDELHLKNAGYRMASDEFNKAIQAVYG